MDDAIVQLTPAQQAQYVAGAMNPVPATTPQVNDSNTPAPDVVQHQPSDVPIPSNTPPPAPASDVVQLTPEQQSQYRNQAGIVDPFKDFSPQQLVDLTVADPDNFDLVGQFANRKDLHADPAVAQKAADAYNLLKQRGVLADLPGVGKIAKTVWETAKGFGKQAWNYAQATAAPVGAAVADIAGQPADVSEGILNRGVQQIAENEAGTESAVTGLASMVGRGAGRIARGVGLSKPLTEYSPEEKLNDLFGAMGEVQQQQQISKGHGEALSAVGGHVVKELEQQGLPVRPEEVSQLAAGDPFSWYAMGGAFQAAKGLPGFARGAGRVEQTLEKTGELAAKAGGAVVTGAAKVGETVAKGVEKVAVPAAAAAGAISGAASHGPTGLVVGGAAGIKAGEIIAGGAEKFEAAAKQAGQIGREIAGKAPVTSAYAQAARDVLQTLPGAATEIGKGVAFDLGLAATTAETPQEKSGIGIGAAFGLLGAGARVGGRVLSGQIIAPREYGTRNVVSSSGQFPAFDTLHSSAIQAATPGVRARVNAVRSFLQGAAPGTDLFLAKNAPSMEQALLNAGIAPEQAKAFSQHEGFFTTDLPGKDGQPRPVILARNIESAPHESFHAVQDVLGESANRELDTFIRGQFTDPQWQQIAQGYAQRLGGGDHWQETILDSSGWGNAEAAEKIHQDIANQVSSDFGGQNESVITELASKQWAQTLADAVKKNPGQDPSVTQRMLWRDILSPTEADAVADRYVAREVAAENFDALFKNTGPTLEGNKTIPAKLARVVGNLVSLAGGEPLAGRTSEIGGFPLKADIVEAVKGAVPSGGNKPTVEPGPSVEPRPKGTPLSPIPPAEAAEEARTAAANAPATPQAGGTASPREILGSVAEAIAQRTGVKLNYLSAPNEPAASITANREARRSIIEAYRDMPAASRALWEKTFFPERVLTTKGGKFQVLGWSPEVFAANAHRLAKFANEAKLVLPYELDPATGSFSEAGWRSLFDDTQKFVSNQVGGRTGAGEELVVPKSAVGAFKPPEAGVAEALPQDRADVINALFGYKLPETPRITGGKLPLNIVAQDVSAATKPGRVEPPVRPRGAFTGEKATELGIEGRPIQEVNPFRNQIAEAARASGKPEPSFIEAQQRLNLENIKEVQGAPEQPEFRGNTLTLTAGFQPKTDSGKALEEKGYKFERGPENLYGIGFFNIKVSKDGEPVGYIQAHLGSETDALVDDVFVSKQYQQQGIGDALYRELATDLQSKGITSLEGHVVHPAPTKIREKLFPGTYETQTGKTVSEIRPEAQFQPSELKPDMETARRIAQMEPSEFFKTAKAFNKINLELGRNATPEQVSELTALRDLAEQRRITARDKAAASRDPKDLNDYVAISTLPQFFNEAIAEAGRKVASDVGQRIESVQAQPGQRNKPNEDVRKVAEGYTAKIGLPYHPWTGNQKVDESVAREIADYYDTAKDAPDDPAVKTAYDALAKETQDQYDAAVKAGMKFEPWTKPGQPYKSSAEMTADVRDNKHLYYFPTAAGHGEAGKETPSTNPMLADVGGVPVNDLFRAVHDYYGHAKEGYEFGPRGELNAYLAHSRMFSDAARPAMAAETLGQNSWVNFGKHLEGQDLKPADRPFAEQKAIILPKELTDAVEPDAESLPPSREISRLSLEGKATLPQWPSSKLAEPYKVFGQAQPKEREKYDPKWNVAELWVDRSGKVNHAGEGHIDWARENFPKDFPMELPMRTPPEDIYDGMYAKGYVRVLVNREENAIYVSGRNITPAHRKALDALSWKEGLPLEINGRSVDIGIQSQPKKAASDDQWKFKPASGSFSKAWITPAGTPIQLGGQWHHEYMADHPELTKQFGLPTKFTEENRSDALKKGFARINYNSNNGTLTVEARARDWRKLSPAVEKLFNANVGKIDNMSVELFNDAVTKIADSEHTPLFRFDDDEKGMHIPFITGSEPRVQAQPASFPNETFDSELEKIRAGDSPGQTFNTDGTVWTPNTKTPVDVVPLASINLPQGQIDRDAVTDALRPYRALLDEPGVVAGLFAFSKDGKPTVSVDVNAIVPQKFRANTVDFAKANDQVAIWDAAKGENVETGGKGDTRLTKTGEILDALGMLMKGKPVDVGEVKRQNADAAAREEETTLPGVGGKRPLSSVELSNMTKTEIADYYPEAIVPRSRDESIPSKITESPLYKASEDPESAFARKLVEFAKEWQDHPSYRNGLKWYSEFVPRLKKEFGADAPIMAELLAATSPNTPPDTNFGFAYDALQGMKSGRFKKLVPKFEEGLAKIADDSWQTWFSRNAPKTETPTPAAFLARWIEKFDLLPRQSNGKLYGMHSTAVLRVFARKWLENTSGLKTQNFVQNLLGTGHGATIDVWADRTMRRVGYSGFNDRWRILPKNGTGVSDEDFKFSQAAFAKAAKELGVKPDALQGGLWFAEKQYWADKGWGRLDLGDFRKEMDKVPLLKAGIESRLRRTEAAKKEKPQEQLGLDIIEPRPRK